MAVLNEIKNGANVHGIVPNQVVEIVSTDWIGDQAINVVYRVPGGSVAETTLYRDDEHRLSIETRGRALSFDASGGLPTGTNSHGLIIVVGQLVSLRD